MTQGKEIYQEMLTAIEEACAPAPGETLIYRGQNVDADWITPSLVRAIHFDQKSRAIDQKAIEKQKTFIEQAQAISQYSDLEALAHLRHYEAPSLLVDFTYDLHVALWFACLDVTEDVSKIEHIPLPKKQAQPSKLFVLKITPGSYIQGKSQSLDTIFSEFETAPFKWWKATPHIDPRINHQKSVFVLPNRDHELKTVSVLSKQKHKIKVKANKIRTLFCFEIKQEEKQALREYVKMFCGITKQHIYPDVVGLANSQKQTFDIQSVIRPYNEKVHESQSKLLEALLDERSNRFDLQKLARAYSERANAFLHVKVYQKAIDDYNEVLKLYPNDAMSHLRLGVAYLAKCEYDKDSNNFNEGVENLNKAIDHFKRAITLKYAYAYSLLGGAYLQKWHYTSDVRKNENNKDRHDFKKAINNLDIAITFNRKDAYAHFCLGRAYLSDGEYGPAIDNFKRVIGIDPNNADAHSLLGRAYSLDGEYDKAINNLDIVIKLNPNDANAHSLLGGAYLKQGKYKKAIDHYKRAIQLNPKDAIAYFGLGYVYVENGKYKKAIDHYKRAIQLNPKEATTHSLLGGAYLKQGKYKKAIDHYKRAIQLNPKEAATHSLLGNAYLKKGKYNKAIGNFKRAIQLNPNYVDTYSGLGCAYFEKDPQELDKAYYNYKQAIALNSASPVVHYNIGEYYLYVDKKEKALEHLTRAYQLSRKHNLKLDATLSDINNGLRKRGLKHLVLKDKEIQRIQGG